MSAREILVTRTLQEVLELAGLAFKDVRLAGARDLIEGWLTRNGIEHVTQIGSGTAMDDLLEQLVVHESYFDRDLDQLRMVDELVFAPREQSREELRVWSAGCAAGEEPYTLAFMLETRGLLQRTSLTATDLSRAALARAQVGRYRAWSLRTGANTPAMRYLTRAGTDLCVPAAIKSTIEFRQLNLVEDPYPANQHLVVCRNVLIYLTAPGIAKVAAKMANALAPDGWLFMAPSDPRLDPYAPLVPTVTDRGIYYRRAERTRAPSVPPSAAVAARAWAPPPVRATPPTTPPPRPAPRPVPPAAAHVPPPTRPLSTSEVVHRLADHGDYAAARDLITKALSASPLDGELYFLEAVLAADEDSAASLRALDRAIYLEPHVPASYLFAGQLRHSRGDVVGARRAYRSALQILETLAPDAPVPWTDEPARLMTTACRQALESLDDR